MNPRIRYYSCVLAVLAMCGCHNQTASLTQPDHTSGVLPLPTSNPATSAEWVKLTRELDDARADNMRKDRELESAENRKAAANLDTWKRFGRYSFIFMALGVALLVANFLPWTKPFVAGTGPIAFIFIGGGVLFGALPHILEQYGPMAFYPLAVLVVLYVGTVACIDIWKRIRRARAEAVVAVKVMDPTQPEEAADLIDLRKENNPVFAKALESVQTGALT